MSDLIKRQDAIDACLNGFCACVSDCVDEIEKLPSAQKTGKWIVSNVNGMDYYYCSECEDSYYPAPIDASWYYCPHCGARMEREEDG